METSRALDFGKRYVKQVLDDDVPELAAALAYRFLFAVFPFAIFLASLASFAAGWLGVGDPTNQIIGAVGDNLPPDVAAQLRPQLEVVLSESRPGLLSFGALAALWATTSGVSSLIKAMNTAYDVEEPRNILLKYLTAAGLTILGGTGIILAFVTIVGGSVLTQQAVETLGVTGRTWELITLLRWPLVLAMVALAVAVLFRFGPNVAISFRWALAGGFAFAIGWTLATLAFGIYVANFANYANTYGALGGVVILMLWFYLTGLLLLLAAELTSLLVKDREPERVEAGRQESGLGRAAGETAKRAVYRGGVAAGVAAGVARSASGGGEADPHGAEPRSRGREERGRVEAGEPGGRTDGGERDRHGTAEPSPVTRIPPREPAGSRRVTFEPRPSRLLALAVLAGGAVVGAVAGLLAGDDDDGAANA